MKQIQFLKRIIVATALFSSSLTMGLCAQTTNCPPGFDAPYCDVNKDAPADKLDHTLEKPPLLSEDLMQKVPSSTTLSAYEAAESERYISAPQGSPTWGALAKDFRLPGIQGLGIANNRLSPQEAQMDALFICQKNGGQDCFIEETYSNRCIGLALSDAQEVYWAIGFNADNAAHNATTKCAQKSSALCKLVYRRCSYAVQ